jgi:hypothetical protein
MHLPFRCRDTRGVIRPVLLAVVTSAAVLGLSALYFLQRPTAPAQSVSQDSATNVQVNPPLPEGATFAGGYYATTFAATENPISESSVWKNGATDGGSWCNVRAASGYSYGTCISSLPDHYTDPTAILKGTWEDDQWAEARVFSQNQNISGSMQAVEIRLRSTISAGVNKGYEVLFSARTVEGSDYAQIVRWNGNLNDSEQIGRVNISNALGRTLQSGDLIAASIEGYTITGYINGVKIMQMTDTDVTAPGVRIASGSPGIGFWLAGDVEASDLPDAGLTEFVARNGDLIYAASGSAANVLTALNAAGTGDTVAIPPGTSNWSTQVSWTAPADALLLGAGSLVTTGGGDATIITDNYASNGAILDITTNASGTFRVAGITFTGGTGTVKDGGGFVYLHGSSTQARIDHNHFDKRTYSPQNNGKIAVIGGTNMGVFDHNSLHFGTGIGWIHIVNGGSTGDSNWAAATGFGSSTFWFLEDNTMVSDEDTNHRWLSVLTDCHTGGRFVARYNTLEATAIAQTHPTGHAGHDRGCRAHETYGNTVAVSSTWNATDEPLFALDYNNSGPALTWGNSMDAVYKSILYFNDCRQSTVCGYTQTNTPGGWGWCGTANSGTGSNWDGNFDVSSGYPCLDQPARGQGDLLSGDFPNEINTISKDIIWPHQALEPIYEWNNVGDFVSGWGGSGYVNNTAGLSRMLQNRDYYLYRGNTNCNPGARSCTAGVGVGTLAQRPATCTTGSESGSGVAWWATDAGGNWNTTNRTANDGALYKCTATNTWTLYYTPYVYPHPLVR